MAIGTPINSTSFNAALKEVTPVDEIEKMIQDGQDDPFLKAMQRIEDIGGYQWRLPVATSTNIRAGAVFATAQSLASNTKNSAFLITYNQIYSIASWSGPVLAASSGDKNAFESVLREEMELAVAALNMKIATQIYRTGTGSITQLDGSTSVSAASSSAGVWPVTLLNKNDVLLFEVGDVVVFSAADGGSLRTGTMTVTGIDLNLGTLSGSTTWSSAITGLSFTDYIYRTAADAANGSTNVCLNGFQAWVPPSTTSITAGDSYFGVNRSGYRSKLAGLFYDNTTPQDSIAEALVNAASLVQAAGAKKELDLIVLNPAQMKLLVNDTSTKIVVPMGGSGLPQENGKVGMSDFSLVTDWGLVPIKQSIFAPAGYGFLISSKFWHLASSGKPGVQEVDGVMALRVSTDDAYEARLAAVNIALGCNAPGYNCIVKF